jgi:hypothetical protein
MTQRSTLYLVSPTSLGSWFDYFTDLRPADTVLHIGEGAEPDTARILAEVDLHDDPDVVIYSSHDTLGRDRWLADTLRLLNHRVFSQSHACSVLGSDKLLMKTFLDRNGFRTPEWIAAGNWPDTSDAYLVAKARNGTQSVGTRLVTPADGPVPAGEFAERYHEGTEFSVIVYRDEDRITTFPPVWKGRTSLNLVPPWRRLRLCPYPELTGPLAAELRETSVAIAQASDNQGYLEVEYLVNGDGVQVLELNPRVSGTMRLTAMATGVDIFSLHHRPDLTGELPAIRWAAEVPYSGAHIALPEQGVFATSRLTVAADSPTAAREKLHHFDTASAPAMPAQAR